MFYNLRKLYASTLLLVFALSPTQSLLAEPHVVKRADLHKALSSASASRQKNLASVKRFFDSRAARKTLQDSQLQLTRIASVIPHLSDDELTRLASQAAQIERDIAAGALTNEQLTYIIIALATAVLILVVIAA